MKKLLFVLALGAFAACGSGEQKEAAADTTVVKVDSPVVAAPDTTVKAPDTTVLKVDTAAVKH